MKKFFTLMLAVFTMSIAAMAQPGDEWKISLDKKVLLHTPIETNSPVVFLDRSIANTKHTISIQYKTADAQSELKRVFNINDQQENTVKRIELKAHDGTAVINTMELKAAAAARTPLFIYTVSLPKDPSLAARVRVRRFLVCKIEWK